MSAFHRFALLLPVLTLGAAPAAQAQSTGYFMPPSAAAPGAPAPAAPVAAVTLPGIPPVVQPVQPPVPVLPALPPEGAPPTAIIGVFDEQAVMQNSTAVQGVQAEVQKREAALKQQEDHVEAQIQNEQQQIAGERGKIPEADFDQKVQDWRSKVAQAQSRFQVQNQSIQNAGQDAMGQIGAELTAIVGREATAHSMNLILHQEQVVMNDHGFDITGETIAALNKLLPSVKVPADFITPNQAANPQAQPSDQGPGQ